MSYLSIQAPRTKKTTPENTNKTYCFLQYYFTKISPLCAQLVQIDQIFLLRNRVCMKLLYFSVMSHFEDKKSTEDLPLVLYNSLLSFSKLVKNSVIFIYSSRVNIISKASFCFESSIFIFSTCP